MKNFRNICACFYILAMMCFLSGAVVFAQDKVEKDWKTKDFCSNNGSWDNKVSFSEKREMTAAAGGLVNVDGVKNGGISVKGENRSDVLIRACVQTWGSSDEEARNVARNIRIETGSVIKAENAANDKNWSVSYEVLVPRSTNLNLTARNGGISISSVEGEINFNTTNGGVSLTDLAGDVKGRTSNGGVNVKLSGGSWKGSGLDVETKNGGVSLTMSENYAARIETGTVNGGFKSEINGLSVEKTDGSRSNSRRISTTINGGGAPIRVITTNGGIRINSL